MDQTSEDLRFAVAITQWVFDSDVESIVEYAMAAEDAGWDAVFLTDYLVFPPFTEASNRAEQSGPVGIADPWITLAAIAARTETIKLASWITPIPRRQPWQLARNLATLDHISNGRVILGTGLGTYSDYVAFDTPYDPRELGAQYDEGLTIIDGLWRGKPFSHDGEFYHLDEVTVLPTPVQSPRIPILIGGIWPNKKPIRRGAKWDGIMAHYPGDGILSSKPRPDYAPEDELESMVAYYREYAENPGDIVAPLDPPDRPEEWVDFCKELGVTWMYTLPKDSKGEWNVDLEQIRRGPPTP